MIKFIRNIPWKEVLIIVLLGALAIGAVVGIGTALTTKTKTVSDLAFARGAIDNAGVFVENDTSIYTKNFVECQGLKIEADFEATGCYQVFYYDSNKIFIGSTALFDTAENRLYDKGTTFPFAKYCKVVITPDTPRDKDGFIVEDYKIKFYEVSSIASKFTITTRKNQSMSFEGLTNYAGKFSVVKDSIYTINAEGHPAKVDAAGKSTTTVAVSSLGSQSIGLVFDKIPANCTYIVANSANRAIDSGTLDVSGRAVVFNMPQNGELLILNFDNDCAPAVYIAK